MTFGRICYVAAKASVSSCIALAPGRRDELLAGALWAAHAYVAETDDGGTLCGLLAATDGACAALVAGTAVLS